jgi:hypothetical protein
MRSAYFSIDLTGHSPSSCTPIELGLQANATHSLSDFGGWLPRVAQNPKSRPFNQPTDGEKAQDQFLAIARSALRSHIRRLPKSLKSTEMDGV